MRVSCVLCLVLGSLIAASRLPAADLIWASDFTEDPASADAGFVELLEAAGHNVTQFRTSGTTTPLTMDEIAMLNAADLVIAGRAMHSNNFDNAAGQVWNEQISVPVIVMSAYGTRNNRMGWQTGNSVPDSQDPTPLVAADPSHFIFSGISFQADGVTMANDYNILIDQGTSTIGDPLVPGGIVLAINPTLADGNAIAIAELPAGTVVTDDGIGDQVLAAPRYFFAGGSREASGMPFSTAGQLDLTDDGQRLFLNTVSHALGIPEPSTWILLVLAFSSLLLMAKRK